MNTKYQIIVADPPYAFSDKLLNSDVARGAAANYSTMTIEDIKQLKVKNISDPNGAILALWVPSSLLQEGLDVMSAWGFNHKQTYVWVKTKKEPLNVLFSSIKKMIKNNKNDKFSDLLKQSLLVMRTSCKIQDVLAFGMGRLFRQTHEICLIGTNKNGIYKLLKNKSQRSVSFGENLKHSAKPEHLQDSLDIMFPDATGKIELFARRERPNWTCLGNEVGLKEDIRDSLEKLV
jgi:N6-adenosine-specific RNA methylase IME4